jgi:hypothetical protein
VLSREFKYININKCIWQKGTYLYIYIYLSLSLSLYLYIYICTYIYSIYIYSIVILGTQTSISPLKSIWWVSNS